VIITRSELDVIAKPVLEQAINATKRAFGAAHKWIRDEPICDIVMVGGTTNWPSEQAL
jgi:molecular chaperone DnaK (HSP70)